MIKKSRLGKLDDLSVALYALFSFDLPTKLIWAINYKSDYTFERINDLTISIDNDTKSFHAQFQFWNEALGTKFLIIKNKGSKTFIINTNVEISYFLVIQMGDYELASENIVAHLKKLQNINAIKRMDNKILNKLVAYI